MPHNLEQQVAQLQQQMQALQREVHNLQTQLGTARVLRAQDIFDSKVNALDPLDSSVVWQRRRESSEPEGTHQILSLVMEEAAKKSWPWPLYIHLTSHQDQGDAVGATVRQHKHGNGWDAAFHAEPFLEEGTGTMIGVNIEAHKKVDSGRSIGLNLQSKDSQSDGSIRDTTIEEAINIQSDARARWQTGIHFDQGSKGTRALWIEGEFIVGIEMGNNSIRMNRGAELIFDETGRFYMKYNPATDRIEFHNRTNAEDDKVIGYISAGAPEHEL